MAGFGRPLRCLPDSILAGLLSRADLRFLSMSQLTAVHALSKLQSWSGYPASPEHLGALGWPSSKSFPYLVASLRPFVASSSPSPLSATFTRLPAKMLQTKDLRAA